MLNRFGLTRFGLTKFGLNESSLTQRSLNNIRNVSLTRKEFSVVIDLDKDRKRDDDYGDRDIDYDKDAKNHVLRPRFGFNTDEGHTMYICRQLHRDKPFICEECSLEEAQIFREVLTSRSNELSQTQRTAVIGIPKTIPQILHSKILFYNLACIFIDVEVIKKVD